MTSEIIRVEDCTEYGKVLDISGTAGYVILGLTCMKSGCGESLRHAQQV